MNPVPAIDTELVAELLLSFDSPTRLVGSTIAVAEMKLVAPVAVTATTREADCDGANAGTGQVMLAPSNPHD